MTNGTLGLSFWLAVAGGLLAFGVSLVVGDAGLLLATIIGIVVFLILWAILGFALSGNSGAGKSGSGKSDAAHPSAAPATAAAPAAALAGTAALAAAAPAMASAPAANVEAAATPAANTAAPSEPKAAAAPAAAAPAKAAKSASKEEEPAAGSVGTAPVTLKAARDGKGDDLKVIEGIGPKMEQLVNSLGFYHFDQLAAWTADEVAWVDSHLGTFRGRIVRDKWVAQAKLIVSEGIPAFLERAKTNNY